MALSKEELRSAIIAQLRLGKSPKDIAEMLDCNISLVYTQNRKLKAEQENEVVQELVEAPMDVVKHVAEEVKKQVVAPNPIAGQVDNIVEGVDGLKKLDMKFQSTMTRVLSKFNEALEEDNLKLSEVKMVADTVANAYNKIFTSGTNIHIGDNNVSSQRLTVFKNKMGV